jgi:hypothetical protein
MKVKAAAAVAALSITLLAPTAAHAGRAVAGWANQTPIDITSTTGHDSNGGYDDATIVNQLVGLIQRTPPGSTIITNVYQTEAGNSVVDALYHAKNDPGRNVNVYVTYGMGGDSPSGAFDWVNSGTPNGETRMLKCPIGCHNSTNPGGKDHSKYFLFYSTQRSPGAAYQPAVWIGSANLNRGSGSKASNNAVTLWNDSDMWWGMWGVWEDAFHRDPFNGDYYRPYLGWQQPHSGIVYSSKAASVAHISPDDDGGDMWANQLGPQSSGGGCIVRVMQAEIDDARLPAVQKLRSLANGGCSVRVILGLADDGSAAIGPNARAALCNAPDTLLRKRPRLHDKAVETYGTFEGVGGRVQMFTGSHNWTNNALRDNDEVLLRLSDSWDAYNALRDHFYDDWNSSLTTGLSGCN